MLVQDKAGKILCGCLAEWLAGFMFAFGLFWSIDADKTDGNLLAIGDNGDCVTVGDSGALELARMNDDRKDEYDDDEEEWLKGSGGHQDAFHALLQMIRLMVEGVTPYFWASCS